MSGLQRIDLEQETLLGVPAGSRHNQYSLAQLGAVAQSDGWLIYDTNDKHQPTIHTWRFTGYRHHQEQVFVVGPWTDGITLDEALAEAPLPELSRRLQLLALALATLADQFDFYGPVQGDAVLFTNDGGLLFLPPPVMRRLNNVKSQMEQLASVERYRHPHRTGPDQLAFMLGVSVYRALCGRFPFSGVSEEEIHDQVRELQIVSPATFQPEAPRELCEAVLCSLRQDNSAVPTLTDWKELLFSQPATKALTRLREPESQALQEASAEAEQAQRHFARRQFLRRNGRRLVGWGAGMAIALSILIPIVWRALEPPITRGLEPLEVVELFYKSINLLDTEPMEDAVGKDGGRVLINETLHMFLESRIALANRGGTQIISATEWDEMGRPADPPFRVYGITNLELYQEQGEPRPIFIADYIFDFA